MISNLLYTIGDSEPTDEINKTQKKASDVAQRENNDHSIKPPLEGVTTKIFDYFKNAGTSWITLIKDDHLADDEDAPLADDDKAALADERSLPLADEEILPYLKSRARRSLKAVRGPIEMEVKKKLRKRGRPKKSDRSKDGFDDEYDEEEYERKKKTNPRRLAAMKQKKLAAAVRKPKAKKPKPRPFSPKPDEKAFQKVEEKLAKETGILEDADTLTAMQHQELARRAEEDAGPPWLTDEGERIINERELFETIGEEEFQAQLDTLDYNVPEIEEEEPELRTIYRKYTDNRKLVDPERLPPDPDKYLMSDNSDLDEKVTEENRLEYEEMTKPMVFEDELLATEEPREQFRSTGREDNTRLLKPFLSPEGCMVGADPPTLEEYDELINDPAMKNIDEELENFKNMDIADGGASTLPAIPSENK
ncbi:hypothetical protein GWI33_013446 [Rhynchophorus ferrugineus]|uniref:Uncharacterized protein n=1 Tax=Rhynchophorus ferrugineus TaxID=354439 RepID=A0A834MD85_RHYFE|nr:hypothetical protein GWI33_013446 [Rhynchophorus ferrugineus]